MICLFQLILWIIAAYAVSFILGTVVQNMMPVRLILVFLILLGAFYCLGILSGFPAIKW